MPPRRIPLSNITMNTYPELGVPSSSGRKTRSVTRTSSKHHSWMGSEGNSNDDDDDDEDSKKKHSIVPSSSSSRISTRYNKGRGHIESGVATRKRRNSSTFGDTTVVVDDLDDESILCSIGSGTNADTTTNDEEMTTTKMTNNTTTAFEKKRVKKRPKIGRWEKWEQIEFLKGLRLHGRGHWKLIAEGIPTRNTVQVKTHAQVEMKKFDGGTNIFEELDEYLHEQEEQASKEENTMAFSSNARKPRVRPIRSKMKKTSTTTANHRQDVNRSVSSKGSSTMIGANNSNKGVRSFASSASFTTTTTTTTTIFASSPAGGIFGAYEAANTLLGLSSSFFPPNTL